MAEEQLKNQDAEQIPPQTADDGTGEAPAGADTAVAGEAPANPNLKWYIIHTYSGFECKVH